MTGVLTKKKIVFKEPEVGLCELQNHQSRVPRRLKIPKTNQRSINSGFFIPGDPWKIQLSISTFQLWGIPAIISCQRGSLNWPLDDAGIPVNGFTPRRRSCSPPTDEHSMTETIIGARVILRLFYLPHFLESLRKSRLHLRKTENPCHAIPSR